MEAETQIIKELMHTIKSIKENSVKTQANLLLEARKTNSLYAQLLSELRRQNSILDDLKREGRVTISQ